LRKSINCGQWPSIFSDLFPEVTDVNPIKRIFNPPVFQGSLRKKRYFEGWYFKNVSPDTSTVYSFIPGVTLSKDPHAFIQIINGISGKSWYIRYPLQEFSSSAQEFVIGIGDSYFSQNSMHLQIESDEITIKGELLYSDHQPFPSTLLRPGIMGWFSFIPFMECRHGVVSASHSIQGSLEIDARAVDFSGGKGYIEKDWGTSFPESWVWLQCNNFISNPNSSCMISIAKIPWMGHYFIGFVGFFVHNNTWFPFATYNRHKITQLSRTSDTSLRVPSSLNGIMLHSAIQTFC
jgi:hypothetical protein